MASKEAMSTVCDLIEIVPVAPNLAEAWLRLGMTPAKLGTYATPKEAQDALPAFVVALAGLLDAFAAKVAQLPPPVESAQPAEGCIVATPFADDTEEGEA